MPYVRRQTYRRTFRKKGTRKPSKAVKTYVRRAIRASEAPQVNYIDYAFTGGNASQAGALYNCVGYPLAGTNAISRLGDVIKVRSITGFITVQGSQNNLIAAADIYNMTRFTIGVWKKPMGIGLAGTNSITYLSSTSNSRGIFQDGTFNGIASTEMPYNWDAKGEIKILRDKKMTVTGIDNNTDTNVAIYNKENVRTWRFRINFKKPMLMRFGTNAGANTDVTINLPFLAVISDSYVTPHPTWFGGTRMIFSP